MTTNRLVFLITACLLLLLPLLPACGGGDDEDSTPIQSPTQTATPMTTPTTMTPAPETTIPAAPAKPEGTLTMALQTIAVRPWIGPFSQGENTEKPYWAPIYDYLVFDAGTDDYIPGLAESWEVVPDGMSITFKLREGVQFHDAWGEMTSEDVKFTIDTLLNPALSECSNCQTNINPVFDRVETNGPYEVTVYSSRARAEDFLGYMCPSHAHGIGISSKAYYEAVGYEEANKHLIGTGPYKFVKFEIGSALEMEAVDDHWRVVPEFEKLIIREVLELTTRVAMMQTGEADIADVSPEQAAFLEGKGFTVVTVPGSKFYSASLLGQWLPDVETYDPDVPWLDERVRKAANLAINREEISQTIFEGYAAPTPMNFHSPWIQDLDPYPYDPDQARQLLAEAGYPDGFDTEIWNLQWSGSVGLTDLLFAVQGYWQDVGINASINPYNVMAVYGDIVRRNTSGKVMSFIQSQSYAPYGQGPTIWGNSEMATFPMYESEEFDALIEEYFGAFTREERDAAGEKMVNHLYNEYAVVPLVEMDAIWAKGDRVGEWTPTNWNYIDLEYITHSPPIGTFRLFDF
jgi:peptide/nickel transport system substrate-binding protein